MLRMITTGRGDPAGVQYGGIKMAEYTNVAAQTVAANANIVFGENSVRGCRCVDHRDGSGIVTLRSCNNGCTRYKVSFGANIAVPDGGTADPISVAISVRGEPLGSATAIYTPATAEAFGNIYVAALITVSCGCCVDVGVVNASSQVITVENANLIVEKEA